ncbi:MAG: DUF2791 family P-loop domain-containing protein [Lachnospiraceae bacterium]|nr:DUF2791 family P-loop domain-containing protein [Lachnospiraceae bacterium]
MEYKMNQRIARTVLHALSGGTVPDNGLQYIAVGRKEEVAAITKDMDEVAEGYSTFRLLEGAYGTGKSFMAKLVKNEALLRGFAVMECELAPERKLCGTKREGLETYRCLLSRMSTRTCPGGNALEEVLDAWVYDCREQAEAAGVTEEEALFGAIWEAIRPLKKKLEAMPHGFDFYEVLKRYMKSEVQRDYETKDAALRWMRGEYRNRTEAKAALKLQAVIDDKDWFSYLKLWSVLLREIGYQGLYVLLDELTQITRNVVNSITREHNFERLLSMYNDCYGNEAKYMGIILCGIPSSIHDKKRGIFSYEALRSRLSNSALQGEEGCGGPIIRLSMLTAEEFLTLLERLEAMHAMLKGREGYFTEEERIQFVNYEYRRIASSNHLTPREFIRDYLTILDLKSTDRKQDGMKEFLDGQKKVRMTSTMIGAPDLEEAESSGKYEGFTL